MKPADYYGDINDRSSAWLEEAYGEGFSPVRDLIEAAMEYLPSGGRALDIGCQGGHQLALLDNRFDEAIGVDIAPYPDLWERFPNIQFLTQDVDEAPFAFADDSFRFIMCTNVLEHVFDVFGLMKEIARMLEPNGISLISVPNAAYWRHIQSLFRGEVPRTGASGRPFSEQQGWDGQHLHYFTHDELKWLVGYVGLMPLKILTYGRIPRLKKRLPRHLTPTIDLIVTKE